MTDGTATVRTQYELTTSSIYHQVELDNVSIRMSTLHPLVRLTSFRIGVSIHRPYSQPKGRLQEHDATGCQNQQKTNKLGVICK